VASDHKSMPKNHSLWFMGGGHEFPADDSCCADFLVPIGIRAIYLASHSPYLGMADGLDNDRNPPPRVVRSLFSLILLELPGSLNDRKDHVPAEITGSIPGKPQLKSPTVRRRRSI
jgi:hypothetical protein